MKHLIIILSLCCIVTTADAKKKKTSGNPIFQGWYADPEGAVLDGKYWVFPTFSAPYDEQLHFDAFSSKDLPSATVPKALTKMLLASRSSMKL